MKIDSVKLTNFRNYTSSIIKFSDGVNFILGKNAQGKTNLLESVYLCAISKSPKTSKEKQMIKFDESFAKVFLDFNTIGGNKNIEITLNNQNKKMIKVNNIPILKLTQLIGELNIVYFSPDEMKLIKEVPEDRRTFLDISISQFDKPYMYNLMKYNRILKMRNQILKSFDSVESKKEQLHLFTPQLIETAEKIIEKRLLFIENLKIIAKNIHKQITDTENLDINYSYQKKENSSIKDDLTNQFNSSLEKDLELGYTTIGPHRDDIVFKINDKDCKYFASQGQQRTVSLVVKLSLMEIIKQEIGEYPVLLLDDVLSELDGTRQDRLLKMTTKYQTIISCVSIPNLTEKFNVIHVENGQIS